MNEVPNSHGKPDLTFARQKGGSVIGDLREHYRHYIYLLARAHMGRQLQGCIDPSDSFKKRSSPPTANSPAFAAGHKEKAIGVLWSNTHSAGPTPSQKGPPKMKKSCRFLGCLLDAAEPQRPGKDCVRAG
jgi:hypothetical protein